MARRTGRACRRRPASRSVLGARRRQAAAIRSGRGGARAGSGRLVARPRRRPQQGDNASVVRARRPRTIRSASPSPRASSRSGGLSVSMRRCEPLDAGSYVDQSAAAARLRGCAGGRRSRPGPGPYPFWHSSQIAPPGRNLASYADPRIDDVLQRGAAEHRQRPPQGAVPAVRRLPDRGNAVDPALRAVYTYVQSTRVQGFSESLLFTPASRFANVNQWYVATRVE